MEFVFKKKLLFQVCVEEPEEHLTSSMHVDPNVHLQPKDKSQIIHNSKAWPHWIN